MHSNMQWKKKRNTSNRKTPAGDIDRGSQIRLQQATFNIFWNHNKEDFVLPLILEP